MQIKSARLLIDKLKRNDASFIIKLLNQPSFLEMIGDRQVHDTVSAITFMEEGPWQTYPENIGMLCVRNKENGEAIGLCGFMQRDYLKSPDLGYAFLESAHGQGYAIEAAQAVMLWGKSLNQFGSIGAMTNKNNVASISLLTKLEFLEVETDNLCDELKGLRYFERQI